MYDSDGNGKVTFTDMLDVLRDLTGTFISEKQREVGLFFCIRVRCLRDWKFHFLSLSFFIRIISIVQTLNKKITNQSLL